MANQHFFKPLLPGFHNHLTIPEAFFLKHIKGKTNQKTAELRSDASKITWKVKIENDQILTDGWKEFVLAHDLRIGDIVVFRKERDMAFHVSLFGPSCCEITRMRTTSIFPRPFVRANGLTTRRGGGIVLMNENGKSWKFVLKQKNLSSVTYIRRGWRSFCHANGLKARNFCTFKLVQRGRTVVLRLLSKAFDEEEEEEEEESSKANEFTKGKEKNRKTIWKPSSSPSKNQFVKVTVTANNFRSSRLVLPVGFTKVTGIKAAKEVSLLDKHGGKWSTNMLFEKVTKRMRLIGGWKEFCSANCVEIRESIILELIWEADRSSVLKFSSKVKPNAK